MNPALGPLVEQWHSGLLNAAAAFGAVSTPFGRDCTDQARSLAETADRYGTQFGMPRLTEGAPRPETPAEYAGSEAVHIYIDLNTIRQDVDSLLRKEKNEFDETGRACAPSSYMRAFFAELGVTRYDELERICQKAFQLRGDMLRRELHAVVPTEYREQMRLHIRDANMRPVPLLAADVALRLYRAGVPGDYAGALANWQAMSGQSATLSNRVVELYRSGVAPEFAAALL